MFGFRFIAPYQIASELARESGANLVDGALLLKYNHHNKRLQVKLIRYLVMSLMKVQIRNFLVPPFNAFITIPILPYINITYTQKQLRYMIVKLT